MDFNENFRIRNEAMNKNKNNKTRTWTKKEQEQEQAKVNQCNYFLYNFFALYAWKYRNKAQSVNYFGNFYKMSQYFASWLSRFGGKDFLLNQEIELQTKNG